MGSAGSLYGAFSQIELPLQGSRFFLDSTHVKVHHCASNPTGGRASQAIGTTRGGLNSKIHAVVDGAGQPVRLLLSVGHKADITHAQTMAAEIPATMLAADKGYDLRHTAERAMPSASGSLIAASKPASLRAPTANRQPPTFGLIHSSPLPGVSFAAVPCQTD